MHGNPDLKAEIQDNYQLAAGFEFKKLGHVFRIEPSLFYNYINNKIDLAYNTTVVQPINQPALFDYVNISKFQSAGTNITAEYRTPVYSFISGYGYTGVNSNIMNLPASDAFFFNHQARFNFNYSFTKQNLTLALFYKYNSKYQTYQYDLASKNITLGYINGYGLFDASATKQLLNKNLSITIGGKNLLNVVNVGANISGGIHAANSSGALIGVGRTFFCSIAYQINFNRN